MKITEQQLKQIIKEELSATRLTKAKAQQAAGHGTAGFWSQGKEQIEAILQAMLKKDPGDGKYAAKWLRELADEIEPEQHNDGFDE